MTMTNASHPARKFPPIGSVSHGTMRNADLIPDFVDLLADYDSDGDYTHEIETIRDRCNNDEDGSYFDSEDADYDLNETLFPALDCIAAPYTHFGCSEGDGSDYGFWISHTYLAEECQEGNVLAVTDLSEVPDFHVGPVLVVNDHGNQTLYGWDWEANPQALEYWSCV